MFIWSLFKLNISFFLQHHCYISFFFFFAKVWIQHSLFPKHQCGISFSFSVLHLPTPTGSSTNTIHSCWGAIPLRPASTEIRIISRLQQCFQLKIMSSYCGVPVYLFLCFVCRYWSWMQQRVVSKMATFGAFVCFKNPHGVQNGFLPPWDRSVLFFSLHC